VLTHWRIVEKFPNSNQFVLYSVYTACNTDSLDYWKTSRQLNTYTVTGSRDSDPRGSDARGRVERHFEKSFTIVRGSSTCIRSGIVFNRPDRIRAYRFQISPVIPIVIRSLTSDDIFGNRRLYIFNAQRSISSSINRYLLNRVGVL